MQNTTPLLILGRVKQVKSNKSNNHRRTQQVKMLESTAAAGKNQKATAMIMYTIISRKPSSPVRRKRRCQLSLFARISVRLAREPCKLTIGASVLDGVVGDEHREEQNLEDEKGGSASTSQSLPCGPTHDGLEWIEEQ